MSRERRQYDKEFKLEAVRLVTEEGRKVSEVARSLGISPNQIHRWKKQFADDGHDAFPGHGKLKPEDEELRRLRRENADLREERDILKKAISIFSTKKGR
jgi:transposase